MNPLTRAPVLYFATSNEYAALCKYRMKVINDRVSSCKSSETDGEAFIYCLRHGVCLLLSPYHIYSCTMIFAWRQSLYLGLARRPARSGQTALGDDNAASTHAVGELCARAHAAGRAAARTSAAQKNEGKARARALGRLDPLKHEQYLEAERTRKKDAALQAARGEQVVRRTGKRCVMAHAAWGDVARA